MYKNSLKTCKSHNETFKEEKCQLTINKKLFVVWRDNKRDNDEKIEVIYIQLVMVASWKTSFEKIFSSTCINFFSVLITIISHYSHIYNPSPRNKTKSLVICHLFGNKNLFRLYPQEATTQYLAQITELHNQLFTSTSSNIQSPRKYIFCNNLFKQWAKERKTMSKNKEKLQ